MRTNRHLCSLASVVLALGCFLLNASGSRVWGATSINVTNCYAYAANLGWVDGRGDVTNGAVMGAYVCSGFIYSANAGWINLGNGTPTNGIRYANLDANDFGVNHDGAGNLQGFAWSPSIGWLTFTNRAATGAAYEGPKVDLFTGKLSGYVWSANAGWLSLSNAEACLQTDILYPGLDSDHDGLPDAWELSVFGSLTVANATTDFDGDSLSDSNEYLAGTDPKNAASNLRITSYTVARKGATNSMSWLSQPTRQYRILKGDRLNPPISWSDVGLGLITPDADGSTSRSFSDVASTNSFYRIQVIKPLSP